MTDSESHLGSDDRSEFGEILAASIETSGLSTAAVLRRLRDRGHELTAVRLSQWCVGMRLPTLETSADVVACLEDVLRLETGTLTDVLVRAHARVTGIPPRPLGNGTDLYPERIAQVRRALGVAESSGYRTMMSHDEVRLDERGVRRWECTRLFMQSEVEGLTSIVVGEVDCGGVDGPGLVESTVGGAVGAVAADRDMRILAVRIDLPRPVPFGAGFGVTVRTAYPFAAGRTHALERWSEFPMQEHVLDVVFHPDLPPRAVESYTSPRALDDRPTRTRHGLLVGEGLAKSIHLNVPPGASGMMWRFVDEAPVLDTEGVDCTPEPAAAVIRAWRELRLEKEIPVARGVPAAR